MPATQTHLPEQGTNLSMFVEFSVVVFDLGHRIFQF